MVEDLEAEDLEDMEVVAEISGEVAEVTLEVEATVEMEVVETVDWEEVVVEPEEVEVVEAVGEAETLLKSP